MIYFIISSKSLRSITLWQQVVFLESWYKYHQMQKTDVNKSENITQNFFFSFRFRVISKSLIVDSSSVSTMKVPKLNFCYQNTAQLSCGTIKFAVIRKAYPLLDSQTIIQQTNINIGNNSLQSHQYILISLNICCESDLVTCVNKRRI